MKRVSTYVIFLTVLLGLTFSGAKAAVFCASNSGGLQIILDAIEDSGDAHEVRLVDGLYEAPVGGFEVDLTNDTSIDISGGWSEFFGNPCGQQLTGNAFNTVLDGMGTEQILHVIARDNSDIKVSHLYFASGFVTGVTGRGGGLRITGLEGFVGYVVVENNAFINNSARFGGALNISRGFRVDVRNNLFAYNHTEVGAAVEIVSGELGAYFNNNTVYGNTTDDTDPEWTAGLFLSVIDSSGLVANNIFWNNDLHDLKITGGNSYFKFNDYESYVGNFDHVEMNIQVEPEFENGFVGYIPVYDSPLVNGGTQPLAITPTPFEHGWEVGSTDLYGNPRIQNTQIDIGATESPHGDLIFMDGFE